MSRLGVLCGLLCAACVQSGEVPCGDGRVCAPGYVCDDVNHRCLSPDQVNACEGRAEGADCSFGGAPGACRMGACEPLVCGDDVRSIGEACDGSDLGTADCITAGFYNAEGLACSSFCTFDVSSCTGFCGDKIINGDELCDGTAPQGSCVELGFDAGALACATSCGFSFAGCGRFGWSAEATGTSFTYGFAATAVNDLWAVGEDGSGVGAIAHFDGTEWTRQPTGSTDKLLAAWAISGSDAWIASMTSTLTAARPLHWDGTQWSVVTAAPLARYADVWAVSSSAVYFATRDLGVQWWNGSQWQALGTLADPVVALRGTSATDIWAAKADGGLVHWNGTAWLPVAVDVGVKQLDVLSASSVWVIGPSTTSTAAAIAHWNGSGWTTYTDASMFGDAYISLLAIADNDVWVAGPSGQVRHFDGRDWTQSEGRVTTDSLSNLIAMRKLGDIVVGAASNGFVHRYAGQMFARLDTSNPNPNLSVWSSGPNDTFVGDLRGGVSRYNGTWTRYVLDTTTVSLAELWGSGPSDVWASGSSGRVHHWNGSAWSFATALTGSVNAIWGSGPSDVWFFGAGGATRFDGMTFAPITTGVTGFQAASGSSANDIWALALGATTTSNVVHYNGSAWTVTQMPHDMSAIVALAPNDVFITADTSHVLHYDGTTWSDTIVPVSTKLDFISATAHDDVIAASASEAVHFNGTRWTQLRLPSEPASLAVRGVHATPGYIDFLYGGTTSQAVRRLIRTQFWSCRAIETGCADGVDDDCDGSVDMLDSDCP